jgi:hypothetical protein
VVRLRQSMIIVALALLPTLTLLVDAGMRWRP